MTVHQSIDSQPTVTLWNRPNADKNLNPQSIPKGFPLKKILLTLLIILLVLIVAITYTIFKTMALSNAPAQSILYTVAIPEENHRIAHVEAQIELEDTILFMTHEGVDPGIWGDFVRNFEVMDEAGNPIEAERCGMLGIFTCAVQYDNCHFGQITNCIGFRPGVPKWQINAQTGQVITLRYDILLEHDTIEIPGGLDSGAFMTDWGVFYVGRALFISNGVIGRDKEIQVTFDLPSAWTVTTPWQHKGEENDSKLLHSFHVTDVTDLQESMLFAGTHTDFTVTIGQQEVAFALGGDEIAAKKEQFVQIMEDGLGYYAEVLGGGPIDSMGDPFAKIAVIINSGPLTDGEAIGRNFDMIVEEGTVEQEWEMVVHLFLHELMHLWNGKTIRPSPTQPWQEEWFKEGITEYYSLKALTHTGFLDEKGLFDRLITHSYERYRMDPGIGELSIQEAAKNKDAHWGLLYVGGGFTGMALDVMIRQETHNEKSFDTLMATLYERHAGVPGGYTTEDVQALAEELSGKDLSEFFQTYVTNPAPLPLEHLAGAGIDARIENGELVIQTQPDMTPQQREILEGILGR
ncbi:MAG: M1 family aminopeptidase [Chloroflexota bacterium]